MGWKQLATQKIEYVDVEVSVDAIPVNKQVWNGKEFIPVTMYRRHGILTDPQKLWLVEQFGGRGPRWDYSLTGMFYIMDEQVYTWFQLKWGNK